MRDSNAQIVDDVASGTNLYAKTRKGRISSLFVVLVDGGYQRASF
jgi:hypothetical protein